MGFISWVKEKVKNGYQRAKEFVLDAVELTCEVIEGIAELTAEGARWVGNKIKHWKNEEERAPEPAPPIIPPEEVKEEIKQMVREKIEPQIREFFNGDVKHAVEYEMSTEQRVTKIQELVPIVAQSLQIRDVPELEFYIPEEDDIAAQFSYGAYNRKENKLKINMNMIASGNPELYAEQVSTVVHELIHCKQWQAVRNWVNQEPNESGYPEYYINILYDNFVNYVRPEENFEAYTKQPVEAEAYYAESILQGFECMNK
ncbi:MAG: hypothetical protein J6K41_04470 [Paraprevotella sp.]|nr:hypothetical protein [Paraprevotella sp.]